MAQYAERILPTLAASVPTLTRRFCTAACACQRREYNRNAVAFKEDRTQITQKQRIYADVIRVYPCSSAALFSFLMLAGFGSGHWCSLGASADLSIFPEWLRLVRRRRRKPLPRHPAGGEWGLETGDWGRGLPFTIYHSPFTIHYSSGPCALPSAFLVSA